MAGILKALGEDSSTLIVTSEAEESVIKSARNLPRIKTIPASLLNVVDILSRKKLLMTVAAVRKAEQLWGKRSFKGKNNAPLPSITPPINN